MQSSKNHAVIKAFVILAFAALVAVALPAQVIQPRALNVQAGIDLWETAPGSHVDFSDNPIPADFFCPGSPAFAGQIDVDGRPLASNPSLGSTDTIIERLDDAGVPINGEDTVGIKIRALSLVGQQSFQACGEDWDVDVYLMPPSTIPEETAEADPSSITIRASSSTGGTFDAWLHVWANVRFTSPIGTVEIADHVTLHTTGAYWATSTAGGIEVSGPVEVDTDGDDVLDTTLPGTTNFHPGWNGPDPVPVMHDFPHLVWPPLYIPASN